MSFPFLATQKKNLYLKKNSALPLEFLKVGLRIKEEEFKDYFENTKSLFPQVGNISSADHFSKIFYSRALSEFQVDFEC